MLVLSTERLESLRAQELKSCVAFRGCPPADLQGPVPRQMLDPTVGPALSSGSGFLDISLSGSFPLPETARILC